MMDDNSSEGLFPAWLLWVIAPVTVLAAALIVLALVLGIQAGQRQVEAQRRQQVGIAIQRAMDYRTEGRLEEALAEYQRVLVLDPGNTAAVTGIENLLELASSEGRAIESCTGSACGAGCAARGTGGGAGRGERGCSGCFHFVAHGYVGGTVTGGGVVGRGAHCVCGGRVAGRGGCAVAIAEYRTGLS